MRAPGRTTLDHLLNRFLFIIEEVDPTDVEERVKGGILERQLLGIAQEQVDRPVFTADVSLAAAQLPQGDIQAKHLPHAGRPIRNGKLPPDPIDTSSTLLPPGSRRSSISRRACSSEMPMSLNAIARRRLVSPGETVIERGEPAVKAAQLSQLNEMGNALHNLKILLAGGAVKAAAINGVNRVCV